MEEEPLESFLPVLASRVPVRVALQDHFGGRAAAVLSKLRSGTNLAEDELDAHDIILDLVQDESEVVESLTGQGAEDEFDINIMGFGPVYWVQAAEFDDIG
jgi:hypothetical protein